MLGYTDVSVLLGCILKLWGRFLAKEERRRQQIDWWTIERSFNTSCPEAHFRRALQAADIFLDHVFVRRKECCKLQSVQEM